VSLDDQAIIDHEIEETNKQRSERTSKPLNQVAADKIREGFVRTPMVPEACPQCGRSVFTVCDELGERWVVESAQVFSQIRDQIAGTPAVNKIRTFDMYVRHVHQPEVTP